MTVIHAQTSRTTTSTSPDATHEGAVPSYISDKAVRLVTLAVLQLWRDVVEMGNLELLQQTDPP